MYSNYPENKMQTMITAIWHQQDFFILETNVFKSAFFLLLTKGEKKKKEIEEIA